MSDFIANCENCVHFHVCKRIDEYAEAVQVLENEASVFDDLVNIRIKCRYFYYVNEDKDRYAG